MQETGTMRTEKSQGSKICSTEQTSTFYIWNLVIEHHGILGVGGKIRRAKIPYDLSYRDILHKKSQSMSRMLDTSIIETSIKVGKSH